MILDGRVHLGHGVDSSVYQLLPVVLFPMRLLSMQSVEALVLEL